MGLRTQSSNRNKDQNIYQFARTFINISYGLNGFGNRNGSDATNLGNEFRDKVIQMQILIMTGPHSIVREISLTARHLVSGGALSLALLVGANVAINDVTNETKDILHAKGEKRAPR